MFKKLARKFRKRGPLKGVDETFEESSSARKSKRHAGMKSKRDLITDAVDIRSLLRIKIDPVTMLKKDDS